MQPDESTLAKLTFFFGWLGGHKFYLGHDLLGFLYWSVTALGLILTLYLPVWFSIPLYFISFPFNLWFIVLFAPLLLSLIEFRLLMEQRGIALSLKYLPSESDMSVTIVVLLAYLLAIATPAFL